MVYGFNPSQYGSTVRVKLSYLKDAPSHVNGEDDEEHHAFLTFVKVRCQLQHRTPLPRGKVPDPSDLHILKNQETFVPQGQIELQFLDGPVRMRPCPIGYSGPQNSFGVYLVRWLF